MLGLYLQKTTFELYNRVCFNINETKSLKRAAIKGKNMFPHTLKVAFTFKIAKF